MNSHCHLLLERGDLEEAQAIAGRAFHRLEGMSGRRPGRVKALNAILRAILDGGEARTPNGPWRTLAGTLPGVLSAPYRLTTLDGQQTLDKEELGRLRARYRQYDLVLDLPGQRAWERERGELPLLRRKVLARILVALLKAAGGEPLTQEELFRAVWEVDYEPESGGPQVRKNMSALRDLLEPDRNAPRYLLLREGAFARKGGYLWSPERSFCLIEAL